ncbi:carbamoyltransferase family protein [Lacinutrix sp. MEBiC02595]
MKDKYILGIHGFSSKSQRGMHNSGVCIIKNGVVIAAVDEERYSRKKNEGRFPLESLKDVFEISGITASEIDIVAMPDVSPLKQFRLVTKYAVKTYLETGVFLNNYLKETYRFTDLKRCLPDNLSHAKKIYVEHHIAHASSAYHTSPWGKATIVTVDGMGDFSMSGITAIGDSGQIKVVKRLNGFYSPGLFYMIITEILGFVSGRHEGKVTGLAAYGKYNKKLDSIFNEFIKYDDKKSDFYSKHVAYEINDYISKKWVNGFNPNIDTNSLDEKEYLAQKERQLLSFREPLKNFSKEDIAFAVQKRLEDIVLDHICNTVKQTSIKDIVLAGGVFANVKLNQKIQELDCIDNVYVFPAMNDSGLSVGAALYSHYNTLKNKFKPKRFETVYLGKAYSNDDIQLVLDDKHIEYLKPENIEKEIAKLISKGKIIAHFNGRMEYGPRALGNRSILASATNVNINKTLNERLKRTEFMPFAPAILDCYAKEMYYNWDKNNIPSQFMTMTFNTTKKHKEMAPATVHIDGTARPQVVRLEDNPRFYNIIKSYYELTGIPIVINTSFNIHEEPIVNTPMEALKILEQDSIDVLVLNDFLIIRK